jgi:hypothetical protein
MNFDSEERMPIPRFPELVSLAIVIGSLILKLVHKYYKQLYQMINFAVWISFHLLSICISHFS